MRPVLAICVALVASCAPRPAPSDLPAAPGAVSLVGAGDIADCGGGNDEATGLLLDAIPGTVFTTGDNAYPNGTLEEYETCYGPNWGRHKSRTRPAPGNHDYKTPDAKGYFDYFGAAAGTPGQGWYSYDAGAWHVVVLNSNCDKVECGADSAQVKWLVEDLAKNTAKCTLAYWHHPRWGGGRPDPKVQPFWDALAKDGAELVLNAHDHFYERLTPLDAAGKPSATGIRQITAGMGGKSLYDFEKPPLPETESRNDKTYGVLQLVLRADGYDWKFVGVPGSTFADSGSAACH